jgi:hypothetical protein
MEIINKLSDLLNNELNAINGHSNALKELDFRFAKEAEFVDRADRIARIDELKSRLASEVDRIRQSERSSESVFDTGQLFNGALGFFAGSMIGKVLKQEKPLSKGYDLFNKELEKKSPFGTVVMALKTSHKIDDIEVIAISSLAREAKTTEAEIISSLKSQGYSLITPEEFWLSLDYVKEAIKEGKS